MPSTEQKSRDSSKEVADLKRQLRQFMRMADADQSYTIPQFCWAEGISRSQYYELKKIKKAPREMRPTNGTVRISPEARRDWRREREAEAQSVREET